MAKSENWFDLQDSPALLQRSSSQTSPRTGVILFRVKKDEEVIGGSASL